MIPQGLKLSLKHKAETSVAQRKWSSRLFRFFFFSLHFRFDLFLIVLHPCREMCPSLGVSGSIDPPSSCPPSAISLRVRKRRNPSPFHFKSTSGSASPHSHWGRLHSEKSLNCQTRHLWADTMKEPAKVEIWCFFKVMLRK